MVITSNGPRGFTYRKPSVFCEVSVHEMKTVESRKGVVQESPAVVRNDTHKLPVLLLELLGIEIKDAKSFSLHCNSQHLIFAEVEYNARDENGKFVLSEDCDSVATIVRRFRIECK